MMVEKKLLAIICFAFVVAISAPMVVGVVQADKEVSESEKRVLKKWPIYTGAESIQAYFANINSYVNDHFGFREDLIALNNKIKYSLNESPSKGLIRGNGDWLFLKTHDPLMSNQKTPKSVVKAQLINRANYVRSMHQELAQKDIAYQHIVAPNKMNVYHEHLPAKYGFTDINATYDYFKEIAVDIDQAVSLNAVEVLTLNKINQYGTDLYFKNDTHWNPLGAYFVYRESRAQLLQYYPNLDLQLSPHLFKVQKKYSGDLAKMTGLIGGLESDEPQTTPADCTTRSHIKVIRKNLSLSTCKANETTMLMFADSFGISIFAYFSESVGKLYMMGQDVSHAERIRTIDELKPDVVVEIIVERSLAKPLP